MDCKNKLNAPRNDILSEKESINKIILKFQSNLIQIGYKSEKLSIHEISEFDFSTKIGNFTEFFDFLTDVTNERNTLSYFIPKNDIKLFKNCNPEDETLFEKELNLDYIESNLEENLIENEIKQLEGEIGILENQIEDENLLYELEKEEENELKDRLDKYKQRVEIIHKAFAEELSEFEKKHFNRFINKLNELNKNYLNIISELNININLNNQINILNNLNNKKSIIGFKKFENSQWTETVRDIDQIIQTLENKFNAIKKEKNVKKEKNEYEEFENILNKYVNLKEICQNLDKNSFLSILNFKKETYLNESISKFIKNNKELQAFSNSESIKITSSENEKKLREKINLLIEIKNANIHREYENEKENFQKSLWDEVISRKNSEHIEIQTKLNQLQKMICSLAPYLILDQNTTQEIFDNLFELTEKYSHYHFTLANNQIYLRLKLNEMKIQNKRTIDERDIINLNVAKTLINETKVFKENSYDKFDNLAVYDICELYKNFLQYNDDLERYRKRQHEILKKSVHEIQEKIEVIYSLLSKIENENDNIIQKPDGIDPSIYSYDVTKNNVKYNYSITRKDVYSIFQNYLDILQNELLIDKKEGIYLFDIIN